MLTLAADGFNQLYRRVCVQPGKEPEVPTEGTGWSTVSVWQQQRREYYLASAGNRIKSLGPLFLIPNTLFRLTKEYTCTKGCKYYLLSNLKDAVTE